MKVDERLMLAPRVALVVATVLCVSCRSESRTPNRTGLSAEQIATLSDADDYDVEDSRGAIEITDPNFPGDAYPEVNVPTIKIATMHPKAGVNKDPKRRLIARIVSIGDYPAMGIYDGINYVVRRNNPWEDSQAATWVTTIESTKPFTPAYTLKRYAHQFTSGDPKQPRLVKVIKASVAFAVCLDDPACMPEGHCGYY